MTSKTIIRRIAAISAAAITAMSAAGMTASAYTVNTNSGSIGYYQNLKNYNTTGVIGYYWETVEDQANMPEFRSSFNPAGRTLKYKNAADYQVMGSIHPSVGTIDSLTAVRQYIDKINMTDFNNKPYALNLIYHHSRTANTLGLRAYDPGYSTIRYTLDGYVSSFTLDPATGQYSGTIRWDDCYLAGMKLSCSDGRTTFSAPNLIKRGSGSHPLGYTTEFTFSGTIPFRTDGAVYFASAQTCTILNDLKVTYNGCGQNAYVTNRLKKTYTKNNNTVYTGILNSTSMTTVAYDYYGGQYATHFKNNRFDAVKVSGSTLQMCLGTNVTLPANSGWTTAVYKNKLQILLNCGYKDAYSHNTWLLNKLNSGSITKVQFFWNSTTAWTGNKYYECTPAEFKTLLGF